MERDLVALGRELAACQDELVRGRLQLQRGRARLLAAVASPSKSSSRLRVLAVAALLFGAAAVGFWLRGPLPLYRLGQRATASNMGEWVAAPGNASVPLSFGDGTELVLQPNGRARVIEVRPEGATVVVERGELHASVRPRQGNHWCIEVGPFRVRVVGTIFEVAWQPDVERFSLRLRKGAVIVAGPVIGVERMVRAGEQLEVWVNQGELRSTPIGALSNVEVAPSSVVAAIADAPAAPSGIEGSVVAPDRTTHPLKDLAIAQSTVVSVSRPTDNLHVTQAPNHSRATAPQPAEMAAIPPASSNSIEEVRRLARSDRYRDAFAAAERMGFEPLCSEASASDLLLLGDVARLAGYVPRAQQAYLAVRRRFGGSPAAQSAFMLGRIAHDHSGSYAEAAEYFATYLREAPQGIFAREAASRLVESRLHAGDRAGAKAAATRYLELYPAGPYAEKARDISTGQ